MRAIVKELTARKGHRPRGAYATPLSDYAWQGVLRWAAHRGIENNRCGQWLYHSFTLVLCSPSKCVIRGRPKD